MIQFFSIQGAIISNAKADTVTRGLSLRPFQAMKINANGRITKAVYFAANA